MKTRLKIWLIDLWILLALWWTWAWLTKIWVIPNRFDFKFLYSCTCNARDKSWAPICRHCWWCSCDWWIANMKYGGKTCDDCGRRNNCIDCDYKPIIYLYPTEEKNISVMLWKPENLLHTYPKYDSSKWWNVVAKPNWDLKDLYSGRKLYALYREWKSDIETNFNEGFLVAWKDIIPFMEEKLEKLWLNEREAEEFIVYWLPQMEWNEWNLIRFETIEEQNKNMPLIITPKPDTIIRIMMDWKAMDEPIEIPEQNLTTPERIWFTVVERWGSQRK